MHNFTHLLVLSKINIHIYIKNSLIYKLNIYIYIENREREVNNKNTEKNNKQEAKRIYIKTQNIQK